MWRYEVPADGRWHEVKLTNEPVHAAMTPAGVEFWAEHTGMPETPRKFQVFGTGHPIPDGAAWWATCDRGTDGIVWHLYEEIIPDATSGR